MRDQRIEWRLLELELVRLLRLDLELAALGHGITRVDHQVHQELMELPTVSAHLEPAVDPRIDADAPVERVPRELHDVVTELRQVDFGVAAANLARKSEEPAGHLRGCRCRSANVVECLSYIRIAKLCFVGQRVQEVDAGAHRTEEVVEVVRDPCAEPPDRFELPALRHLLFHRVVVREQQEAASNLDAVSVGEHLLGDRHPVDERAVAALEILDHERAVRMLENA